MQPKSQKCVAFLLQGRNYDVVKLRILCILLNKNINFNKNETESKMKNPTHSFKETNLILQFQKKKKKKKICKSKVKLWWNGAHIRKKSAILYHSFCPKEFFFNICVLSQCIVYWKHFQNKYTFTYQKILFHTLFCLFLKSLKAFGVFLNWLVSCIRFTGQAAAYYIIR